MGQVAQPQKVSPFPCRLVCSHDGNCLESGFNWWDYLPHLEETVRNHLACQVERNATSILHTCLCYNSTVFVMRRDILERFLIQAGFVWICSTK